MIHPEALLFALVPPLILGAALILTRRVRLGRRILISGVALLLSIPFGMLWTVPDDATYRDSIPGWGVVSVIDGLVPLFLGWGISCLLWFIGSGLTLVGRMGQPSASGR